jgi:hypothetical protein
LLEIPYLFLHVGSKKTFMLSINGTLLLRSEINNTVNLEKWK